MEDSRIELTAHVVSDAALRKAKELAAELRKMIVKPSDDEDRPIETRG